MGENDNKSGESYKDINSQYSESCNWTSKKYMKAITVLSSSSSLLQTGRSETNELNLKGHIIPGMSVQRFRYIEVEIRRILFNIQIGSHLIVFLHFKIRAVWNKSQFSTRSNNLQVKFIRNGGVTRFEIISTSKRLLFYWSLRIKPNNSPRVRTNQRGVELKSNASNMQATRWKMRASNLRLVFVLIIYCLRR